MCRSFLAANRLKNTWLGWIQNLGQMPTAVHVIATRFLKLEVCDSNVPFVEILNTTVLFYPAFHSLLCSCLRVNNRDM